MESVLPGSRFDLDAIFGDWGWTAPQSLVISLLARCAKVPASRTTSRCLSIPKCDVRPSPRQPVVAVARKKKELVGNFKDAGREWHPAGQPERVQVHDFPDEELGKVAPYGVYDPVREGCVNVGTDHDIAAFAVASIRSWWQTMGREAYPEALELLITTDGTGSNDSHCRLWKGRTAEVG